MPTRTRPTLRPTDVVPVTTGRVYSLDPPPGMPMLAVTPACRSPEWVGVPIPGTPVERSQLPARLFHTTAHADAVMRSGYLAPRRGGGLDAPQTVAVPVVCLTGDRQTAQSVAVVLLWVGRFARGETCDIEAAALEVFGPGLEAERVTASYHQHATRSDDHRLAVEILRWALGAPQYAATSEVMRAAAHVRPDQIATFDVAPDAIESGALLVDGCGPQRWDEFRVYGRVDVRGATVTRP